jgi:hypothetical protein
MMTHLSRFAVLAAVAVFAAGCPDEQLTRQLSQIQIVPDPTAGQVAINDPPGINLGEVPLFGTATANFKLVNNSLGILRIESLSFAEQSGGTYSAQLVLDGSVVTPPIEIRAQGEGQMSVTFTPEDDQVQGRVVVALATNAGRSGDEIATAQVIGVGDFIGAPNLVISYNGATYELPGDCAGTEPDGYCRLPTLDFGNVPLNETGSTTLSLRNLPAAGECQLPDQNGEPNCTPVCALTFDADASGRNLGVGFEPAGTPFSTGSSLAVPVSLVPAKPECPATVDFLRGEIRLRMNYAAGPDEIDSAATFVIESNDPTTPHVVIPLAASARRAPVAVAEICGVGPPEPAVCARPDEIAPLDRVYFSGVNSYDPNNALPLSYAWEVVDVPPNTDPELLALQGETTDSFSLIAILPGDYRVRLRVRNQDGVTSGIGATSDVTFTVVPQSRFHVQLVWDHPRNDMDLHLVYADGDPRVYHADYDCFWKQCHPGCTTEVPDPCDSPVHWFTDETIWEMGNPRLDIDDTNGLGPENINIDRPRPGTYHVYVHYYGLVQGDEGPTQVTVRLYLDGILRHEFRRVLNIDEMWAAAQIEWRLDEEPVVTPSSGDNAVQEINYLPFPQGYDFGTVFP